MALSSRPRARSSSWGTEEAKEASVWAHVRTLLLARVLHNVYQSSLGAPFVHRLSVASLIADEGMERRAGTKVRSGSISDSANIMRSTLPSPTTTLSFLTLQSTQMRAHRTAQRRCLSLSRPERLMLRNALPLISRLLYPRPLADKSGKEELPDEPQLQFSSGRLQSPCHRRPIAPSRC